MLAGGPRLPSWRRDVDPLGLLGAVFGGTGWGAAAPGTRRPMWTAIAGPAGVLIAGAAVVAGFGALFPASLTGEVYRPSDVLRGVPGPAAEQLVYTTGVGLMCFAVVALMPLPPCDGWTLLKRFLPGVVSAEPLLAGRRVGSVLLLVLMAVPIGGVPPLHRVLDVVVTPLARLLL
ncbi:hypothetical protein Afil01_41150 [Actinorhabdospora filicis]|uniref:Uncharacterized protein n=1 Tax=Actinorhabdospora filicis TaxID=1785913 RepID=A0A9W6SN81_9ACTN|nr:hypothetical protein [Actinorhabdospora filicis]GLZ79308.1 hypothetical protein Afil01_41150 [Actinorhabdospora filicis]